MLTRYKVKMVGRRVWTAIKRLCGRIMQKIDDAIPSRKTRLFVLAILIALDLLLAYLIAVIQVGIWNGTVSIGKMFELYIWDDYDFPFLLFLLLTVLLVGVVYWLLKPGNGDSERNFSYSDSDVYGSAREISMDDLEKVADVMPIESLPGTILGQLDTTSTRVIGIPPNPTANKNLLVVASPGQGKSFSIVENQIMQALRRGESVVCTDTKGEIRAKTIEPARRYGYVVKVAWLHFRGVDVRVRASELSYRYLPDLSKVYCTGDKIRVMVVHLSADEKTNLPVVKVSARPLELEESKLCRSKAPAGSVHCATITSKKLVTDNPSKPMVRINLWIERIDMP